MKLFSLRLTTLKSKLYAIVFASFVVRVVAFFALPNTVSRLVPDEGTYVAYANTVSKMTPIEILASAFNASLLGSPLVIPAGLLAKIGLSEIDSIRLVSSAYGLTALILICLALIKFLTFTTFKLPRYLEKQIVTIVTIFALLPSHLIWSVLGLREAVMEFWVLIVFALVFYVFEVKKSPSKLAFLGMLIAIPLVFLSRPQVGWVLGVTLLIYFLFKVRVRAAQILIPLTIIGIVSGYVVTTAFSIETTETFIAHAELDNTGSPSSQAVTPAPTKNASKKPSKSQPATSSPTATSQAEFDASLLCKTEGQEVSLKDVKYICGSRVEKKSIAGLKNPGKVIIDQADAIPLSSELNKIDAASVIKTQDCPNAGTSRFDKYFCIAYRAPYTTFTFLFRPLLGPDVTSSSSLFAALENVFWLAAFLFVLVMFVRNRRLAFFGALTPSLLFFLIYSVGAGAYEGNMGTAFRHKSLILWVVILLLASTIVATKERKAESKELTG